MMGWEIFPIWPLHTTMEHRAELQDAMDKLHYEGNASPSSVEEKPPPEHFFGVSLGINGGYAGWNVWWPAWRRLPRVRWAAMMWRQ